MASSLCRYLRKNEQENNDKDIISYQIILEASSSDSDCSDTESIQSYQANTTVSAKDTSDISTDNLSEYYMSEYEVVSSPDTLEPSIFDKEIFSSSSSPRDITIRLGTTQSDDSDVTDISEYDSDCLGALPDHKFYRTCAQCFSYNSNPAFRFCDSCYQVRKEFYPSKPKRRNKRKNPNNSEPPAKKLKVNPVDDIKSTSEVSDTPVDSGSSQPSSDQVSSVQDSGFESLLPSAEWEVAETKDKCMTCLSENVNGLFLHGKTSHRCCCYKCSKKIWAETRRCPMCRRKIHNVSLLLNC